MYCSNTIGIIVSFGDLFNIILFLIFWEYCIFFFESSISNISDTIYFFLISVTLDGGKNNTKLRLSVLMLHIC